MKPIEVTQEAAIPTGAHKGIIIGVNDEPKIFNPVRGPEETLEIVIKPAWKRDDDTDTLAVACTFKPTLNSLSALSKLLARLNIVVKKGEQFDPGRLIGTQVAFTAKADEKTGFVKLDKDSIRAL